MKRGCHEYVIDGYNLIHHLFPDRKQTPLEAMRREMEKLLLAFHRDSGNPLTVVYDGNDCFREHSSGAPLHIVFTPASKSADLWMVDYVKSLNTKIKLVTIVSSDNELRTYASAFGARCMKSEEFAELLHGAPMDSCGQKNRFSGGRRPATDKSGGSGELCDREIERWKKLFLERRR
ncbi:MAG: NYN domain-containing protein [Chlorobiaceae bacterium]|nr:NYN domain-containing protein [Chlorobiaceae bacterium]